MDRSVPRQFAVLQTSLEPYVNVTKREPALRTEAASTNPFSMPDCSFWLNHRFTLAESSEREGQQSCTSPSGSGEVNRCIYLIVKGISNEVVASRLTCRSRITVRLRYQLRCPAER